MKIGIIGHGRIGKIHYRNVANILGANDVAVCDKMDDNLKSNISEKSTLYSDYQSLINEFKPNAVYICSSTPSHVEMIKYCCEKNVHVFCEKPISHEIDELFELRDIIHDAGILLHVGFNRRYDPEFISLKDRILLNDIGKLQQLQIINRDPFLPPMDYIKGSGGMFLDLSIHDFDMARHLVGYEVNELYAIGEAMNNDDLREYGDIDTSTTVLSFTNGVQCIVVNSRDASYGYDQRIEAFGETGLLKVNNRVENQIELWNNTSLQAAKPEYTFLQRYADSYRIETECFIDHLNGKRSQHDLITMDDTIMATQIAVSAQQSMEMKIAVQVPCDI